MAKYTYKCTNEHLVEHTYGMLEQRPETIVCPICAEDSKRVFESPKVMYRGNGFYSTDNNNDHKKKDKPVVDNTTI